MLDGQGRHSAPALLLASLYVALTAAAAHLVNRIVSEPYLDEIFHIQQAQQYCKGQWRHYDPKLTTPPGLYVISVAGAKAVAAAQGLIRARAAGNDSNVAACLSVPQLRYTCLLAALAMPWILSIYVKAGRQSKSMDSVADSARLAIKPTSPMEALVNAESNPSGSARAARSSVASRRKQVLQRRRRGLFGVVGSTLDNGRLTLDVHAMASLPPLWFFGLLYYTDVPSTALVMAMLAAARKERHALAATLGAISLTLRQTNVVWIMFAFGESAITMLSQSGLDTRPLSQTRCSHQLSSLSTFQNARVMRGAIKLAAYYVPTLVLTAAFVVKNGAIVLGDREQHTVSTHWVQPIYGAAFAAMLSWPVLLADLLGTRLGGVQAAIGRLLRPLPLLSCVLVSLAAIHFGTVAHPYLLADNRHYAFYIWRRIIDRTTWSRYVLAIPYALACRAWWIALARRRSIFWIVGFVTCLCAAVVPSPLIEPRYFLVPCLIARAEVSQASEQVKAKTGRQEDGAVGNPRQERLAPVLVELAWYSLINATTLYLFLERPFRWSGHEGLQRFLW